MSINSFAFTVTSNENQGDFKALEKFVSMCLLRMYEFNITWESVSPTSKVAIVEVEDIDIEDKDTFSEYEEIDDDCDCDYDAPDDIELGFNPYMGCYDYDC